jgi:hypothetical protein
MRMTVKIRMPHDTHERDFHLHESKAEDFAQRVRADGGTASVVDFQMAPELRALLQKAGVETHRLK